MDASDKFEGLESGWQSLLNTIATLVETPAGELPVAGSNTLNGKSGLGPDDTAEDAKSFLATRLAPEVTARRKGENGADATCDHISHGRGTVPNCSTIHSPFVDSDARSLKRGQITSSRRDTSSTSAIKRSSSTNSKAQEEAKNVTAPTLFVPQYVDAPASGPVQADLISGQEPILSPAPVRCSKSTVNCTDPGGIPVLTMSQSMLDAAGGMEQIIPATRNGEESSIGPDITKSGMAVPMENNDGAERAGQISIKEVALKSAEHSPSAHVSADSGTDRSSDDDGIRHLRSLEPAVSQSVQSISGRHSSLFSSSPTARLRRRNVSDEFDMRPSIPPTSAGLLRNIPVVDSSHNSLTAAGPDSPRNLRGQASQESGAAQDATI